MPSRTITAAPRVRRGPGEHARRRLPLRGRRLDAGLRRPRCRLRDAKGLHHIAYLLRARASTSPLPPSSSPSIAGRFPSPRSRTEHRRRGPRRRRRAIARRAREAHLPAPRARAARAVRRAERSNDTRRAAAVRTEMQLLRTSSPRPSDAGARRARPRPTSGRGSRRPSGSRESWSGSASRHPPLAEHLGHTIRTGLRARTFRVPAHHTLVALRGSL